MKDLKKAHFETIAIHAGQSPDPSTGAIMTPIYQTSTYVQKSPGVHQGYEYARSQNPTRTALEENLAAMEGAKWGFCFASGCAAMTATIGTLRAGDHVLVCDDVYGGTYRLFSKVFSKFGVEFSFVDLTQTENLEKHWKKTTKLLWLETPTNPLLKILDIQKLSELSHARSALVLVDNTFCSPYLQQPLQLGADLVLHSTTKYLGGHSDVVGGFVGTSNDEVAQAIRFNQNSMGGVPAPLDCFLALRGTKTLAVRMDRHCENAQKIAEFLAGHCQVEKVIYPGLKNHLQYEIASRQMKNFGGLISFVVKGGLAKAKAVLENVKIFSLAESLGGVESLIEHPAIMTHASVPAENRKKLGIVDGLIRISVGIENEIDLVEDLKMALQ
jgi:cystathionine gamma-lyase